MLSKTPDRIRSSRKTRVASKVKAAQNERGEVFVEILIIFPFILFMGAMFLLLMNLMVNQDSQDVANTAKYQIDHAIALKEAKKPVTYVESNQINPEDISVFSLFSQENNSAVLNVNNKVQPAEFAVVKMSSSGYISYSTEKDNSEVLSYKDNPPEEGSLAEWTISIAMKKAWESSPDIEPQLGKEANGRIIQAVMSHYKELSKIKLDSSYHYGGSQATLSNDGKTVTNFGALGIGQDQDVENSLITDKTSVRSSWWGTGENSHYVSVYVVDGKVMYISDDMKAGASVSSIPADSILMVPMLAMKIAESFKQ